jgi:hypothetical protein
VLHCAVDGLAADGALFNGKNDEVSLDESGTSKVRVYKADLESIKNVNEEISLCGAFLLQAAEFFQGKRSSFRRGKPLLALELTDKNDASKREKMIYEVYSIVDKYGVDIALCVPQEDAYVATVELREKHCPLEGGPFWMLTEAQLADVARLQSSFKAGRLSVFVGAGVSIPSGTPSWEGLLEMLAVKADMNEEDREHLKELGFLDQPTILEEDMGDKFKPAVAECIMESARYTPGHALLTSLKVPAVTTNYDTLYEAAAASAGDTIPTLPWEATKLIADRKERREKHSLLKLHGCVKHPENIILTRLDYMRYPDTSQALRGRLHGMFLTSEMLFTGFSMTDDNVHKIIDDVRKVLYVDGKPPKENFGTILTMTHNKMFNRLWDQDFYITSFGKSWADNPAWFHDCFLDCMVSGCAGSD